MTRLTLILLMLFTLPTTMLHAQDDDSDDGYAIALERIQDAQESGATELDLQALGLTELPPELFELSDCSPSEMDADASPSIPVVRC